MLNAYMKNNRLILKKFKIKKNVKTKKIRGFI